MPNLSNYLMKSLSNIDLGENTLWNPVIHPSATAPVGPSLGQVYFDTIDEALKIWVGSNWVSLATGTTTGTTASEDSLLTEGASGDTLLI